MMTSKQKNMSITYFPYNQLVHADGVTSSSINAYGDSDFFLYNTGLSILVFPISQKSINFQKRL